MHVVYIYIFINMHTNTHSICAHIFITINYIKHYKTLICLHIYIYIMLIFHHVYKQIIINTYTVIYPLVICYIAIENGHRNSEFSYDRL